VANPVPYVIGFANTASTTSLTVPVTTATTAGDFIFFAAAFGTLSVASPTITDSKGNSWTTCSVIASGASSNVTPIAAYYMPTTATTALTTSDHFTLTPGVNSSMTAIAVGCSSLTYFTGGSPVFDTAPLNTGTSTALDSGGSDSLTHPGILFMQAAWGGVIGNTGTVGGGGTQLKQVNQAGTNLAVAYYSYTGSAVTPSYAISGASWTYQGQGQDTILPTNFKSASNRQQAVKTASLW